MLVSRVEKCIRARQLVRPGDTLVVGLSGGADSIFLLDVLSRLPDYNLHLVAAHLNHCLRGEESDADQEFCREVACRYAIPFETLRVDIKKLADDENLNLEDAGRRARISFFDDVAVRYNASAVALAHHADDQAETVLMRLLRGSGMTGLSAMSHRNARGYIRPLLDVSRSEIESHLHSGALEWREDASNSDTAYLRNRIRHELLPLLETYNPAIRSSLATTASIISDDESLLDELTEDAAKNTCHVDEGKIICNINKLQALNPSLLRRVLRHAFRQLTGVIEGLGWSHIKAVCDIICSERPNSRFLLPNDVTAIREYDRLLLAQDGHSDPDNDFEFLISDCGYYELSGGGTVVVETAESVAFSMDQSVTYFDQRVTPFPWFVRTFRPGDRIVPLGMTGRKKVKNIFIDRKIPLSERKRIPLLFCGEDLMWIAGVCCSEKSRINDMGGSIIKATFTRP